MGQLVSAFAVSHTSMIIRRYDETNEGHRRVHEAFAEVSRTIAALDLDGLIVVGSDHRKSFTSSCVPSLCVGIGTKAHGWGDAGIQSAELPIHSELAWTLLESGLGSGFDLASSTNPQLDHGFMTPLWLVSPTMDLPIVPVFQNTSSRPLAPLSRSADLGRLIARVVHERPDEERFAVMGVGGLSHWVGGPGMGRINEEFDHWFLEQVTSGDLAALEAMSSDEVIGTAGAGGREVANWITTMAAAGTPGRVIAYEPVREWVTGIGMVEFPGHERGDS